MKKSLPPNDETAYGSRDVGCKPAIYQMHCAFVLGPGLQGMPISLCFWEWGWPKRGNAHITVTSPL